MKRDDRPDTIGKLGRLPARTPKPPLADTDRGRIGAWLHDALFDNIGLKFLSMVLAITVFLLVNTDRDRERTVAVGVSYTMPDDKVLISERLDEVRITVKGPAQRVRKLEKGDIDPINIDLRHAQSGELTITPDMFTLPPGSTVTTISPRTIRVAFDRRVEKIVEITPQLAGRPMHGYVVSEVKAIPATIKVRGAESVLSALTSVRTAEVSVESVAESFPKETKVFLPNGVEAAGSADVVLQIGIDEELVTRRLPGQAVHILSDGLDAARWQVTPAQVEVTLTGTLLSIEKAKGALEPVVRLSGNDTRAREAAVSILGLPPGIGVKLSPERVKISPRAPPGPSP